MGRTVADTIRELTRIHLEQNNGLLLGQCVTAVGWIQNTVPPITKGIVELPMNDVSGPGIAVGTAIAGRRPILVLRFQSFLWLAVSPIVNYAAKAKDIWGISVPILVRAIATEGGGSGPVHSNCFHNIFMHMPGMRVCAPMTPNEYEEVWKTYMKKDDPILVSEHRKSYLSEIEMPDIIHDKADITIFPISAARFNTLEAVELLDKEGIKCNVAHVMWLKPFEMGERFLAPLTSSGLGLVIDSAFEIAGASQSIAYDLMLKTGVPVKALGQFDRSSGAAPHLENGTPTPDRIVHTIKEMLEEKETKV
jgi:acetoin:2,6-dichlorophenolindophenol oxidoreductase subunit beta